MNSYLGAPNRWDALPEPERARAAVAGEEVIARIEERATDVRVGLNDWDRWLFRHSPFDIIARHEAFEIDHTSSESDAYGDWMQNATRETNDVAVALIRGAITAEKKSGARTVKVRPGLRLPVWWEDRYELIYQSDLPWMVSAFLQSAFMGNIAAGEQTPWTSR